MNGKLLDLILGELNTDNINIAEIGVYKGRMTAMWGVKLINKNINYKYYAIDHFLGSEEHDKDVNYYEITLSNLLPLIGDNLKVIRNESIKESYNYPDNFFDIVYLDASHDYDSVRDDIIHWTPKVKAGGFICGDDYISGWPGVIKAVDETLISVNHLGGQQWWKKI